MAPEVQGYKYCGQHHILHIVEICLDFPYCSSTCCYTARQVYGTSGDRTIIAQFHHFCSACLSLTCYIQKSAVLKLLFHTFSVK